MRPSLQELCGIDERGLMFLPHYEAMERIIAALQTEHDRLAAFIHACPMDSSDYECYMWANSRLKYIKKTIKVRQAEYDSMMADRKDKTHISRLGKFIHDCIGRFYD